MEPPRPSPDRPAARLAAPAVAARGSARSVLYRCRRFGRTLRLVFLLLALADAAEALSYLVPSTLWPRADMATAIAAALASPGLPARAWRWGFVLYALTVAGAAMASRWRFG